MRNAIRFFLAMFLFLPLSLSAQKLLIAGCNFNKIMLIDKASGAKEWVFDIPDYRECNSASLSKNKKTLVYSNKHEVCLVDFKTKEIVWKFKPEKGQEAHTAHFLPNGNILVGVCAIPQARILELDKNGKILKETNFETGIENPHGQFRQIIKNKKGNYVVPLIGKGTIAEINPKGEIVRNINLKAPIFSVKELKNGNWLLSCDGGRIFIVNPNTEEKLRVIDNSNINGAKMLFMTEARMLKNGNILASNWNGHSKDKSQPKLMEIDKNNKVVWVLKDDAEISNISAVSLVER